MVGFKTRDLRILAEGQSIFLIVDGRGFSYGSIPVEVTPLPCSDYPGDLSALFSDIPTASITSGTHCKKKNTQLIHVDTQTVSYEE